MMETVHASAEDKAQCEEVATTPVKGKGKGKGKGKAPAPPPPGKAPGPPPPSSKKVPPIAGMDLAAAMSDQTLFGRKLHWVKPGYHDPAAETVFRELDDQHKLHVDTALLTTMFGSTPRTSPLSGRNSLPGMTPRRSAGMALLDSKRAQNMAIVFGQLKSSTDAICEQLRAMDFSEPLLNTDQVDLILGALPTPEEAKLILGFASKKESLRDVERKVLPFCEVPRCDLRLRLLRVSMTHIGRFESITIQLKEFQLASRQLMESSFLRKLFATVLETGNQVNGVADSSRAVKSFAPETLPSICTFKCGETSMVHFLCLTLRKSDPFFLQNLLDELGSLKNAARIKMDVLQEEVDDFRRDAISVEKNVKDISGDNAGPELEVLCQKLQNETAQLQEQIMQAQHAQSTAQAYFGATGKLPSSTVFFGYFTDFLSCLVTAWQEIGQKPGKWRRFSEEHVESKCACARDVSTQASAPSPSRRPQPPPDSRNSPETLVPKLRLFQSSPALLEMPPHSCDSIQENGCSSPVSTSSDSDDSEPNTPLHNAKYTSEPSSDSDNSESNLGTSTNMHDCISSNNDQSTESSNNGQSTEKSSDQGCASNLLGQVQDVHLVDRSVNTALARDSTQSIIATSQFMESNASNGNATSQFAENNAVSGISSRVPKLCLADLASNSGRLPPCALEFSNVTGAEKYMSNGTLGCSARSTQETDQSTRASTPHLFYVENVANEGEYVAQEETMQKLTSTEPSNGDGDESNYEAKSIVLWTKDGTSPREDPIDSARMPNPPFEGRVPTISLWGGNKMYALPAKSPSKKNGLQSPAQRLLSKVLCK
jgi:hypothetical protein